MISVVSAFGASERIAILLTGSFGEPVMVLSTPTAWITAAAQALVK
jgi:hypothetical protein